MPTWLLLVLAVGVGAGFYLSRRSGGSNQPGLGNSRSQSSLVSAPPNRFSRPVAPSSQAFLDVDRNQAGWELEEARQEDYARDQAMLEERDWEIEQQQLDDDYVSSGGYY